MSIDFSNEQEQTFDFDFLKVAEDVMETVLDQEGCPYESQVCLVLTDNETIHKTNLEYRQIDRATDVLSFPMVDFPAPAYRCRPGRYGYLVLLRKQWSRQKLTDTA